MSYIFYYCKSLIKIEFISIDISKVNDMNHIFDDCKSLEYLDLSNFDTSNVKDMRYMFNCCSKLKEIKGINNFNTSKVKNMRYMFFFCGSLEYLDLSNFDTSNVEDMDYMFGSCCKLKEIRGINNFKIKKNCNISGIFDYCNELDYLTISNNKIITDNKKLIAKYQNSISIMFFIPDKNIHYPIPSKESDSIFKN